MWSLERNARVRERGPVVIGRREYDLVGYLGSGGSLQVLMGYKNVFEALASNEPLQQTDTKVRSGPAFINGLSSLFVHQSISSSLFRVSLRPYNFPPHKHSSHAPYATGV
jgi:hypothetical protein